MWRMFGIAWLAGCSDFAIEKVKEPPIDGDRVLEVDPGEVDFGVLASNGPVTETLVLTATGELPVTLGAITVTGSAAYTVTVPTPTDILEPGDTLDLVVTYVPASADDRAQVIVESDAVEPSLVVPLLGAGLYPALTITPSSLYFLSEYGESVDEEVTVTSVGTADLEIASLFVEGAWFDAAGDVPVTLPPGESTTLTVTYTPEVEGETVVGKLWLTTNTAGGFAIVPLEATYGLPCIGLGEAWDRGLLTAETMLDGLTLHVSNLSMEEDICVDRWYVYLSEGSQDLGAGDMDADFGDPYPYGSLEIPAGTSLSFSPSGGADAAWWCMEETQYTDRTQVYEFIGAYVPEPLLTEMLAGDQDGVWAWMDENPVMIAARGTSYVEVSRGGGEATVGLRVLNMGGADGQTQVRETVPAGWSARDFSLPPDRAEVGTDGATVYVWDIGLDAREETDLHEHTAYDEQAITYTLTVPGCFGRQYVPSMYTTWTDSAGDTRTASASPLVVNCVE